MDGTVGREDRGVNLTSTPLAGAASDCAYGGGFGFAGACEEASAWTALLGLREDAAVDPRDRCGKQK